LRAREGGQEGELTSDLRGEKQVNTVEGQKRWRDRTQSGGEEGDEDADLPRKSISVKQKRRDRGAETHEGDEAVLSGLVVTRNADASPGNDDVADGHTDRTNEKHGTTTKTLCRGKRRGKVSLRKRRVKGKYKTHRCPRDREPSCRPIGRKDCTVEEESQSLVSTRRREIQNAH
jgi:hypothetical protein